MSSQIKTTLNVCLIAFAGVWSEQVIHEASHGIAAVLVGAKWVAFNLFNAEHVWLNGVNVAGEVIIAGNAALVNILCGLGCMWLFPRLTRPTLKLFAMYFGAYSLFAGFGYLLVDSIFYKPGNTLGDWKYLIDLLGGSWAIRAPLLIIGALGTLWGFVWVSRCALRFVDDLQDRSVRVQTSLTLLLIPYVVNNVLFTVLAIWHPLGQEGLLIEAIKYWFGFIGFFWSAFIAGYWLRVLSPITDKASLPTSFQTGWLVMALVLFAVAVGILLPTLRFSI